jgi:hypothetical protein
MSEWLPIESAPKDGTDIIVGFDVTTVWIVHVAWYIDGSESSGADTPDDIGWWSYVRHSVTQEKLEGIYEPTHWMPLPEPPAASAAESGQSAPIEKENKT